MAFSNLTLLEKAYEVVKAYASSGGSSPLDVVLRRVYEELVRLNQEASAAE